ncbi:MAG: UbiX family flavin prenyltransferase [Phycisphaeraceae bacterium]|nr:UbiX family flavin prenyltransferase [Phycisphaerales bacterium]MCB9841836.1 UbiX family flavin prenyltransferase [Phycisphaeraceae bacterium]
MTTPNDPARRFVVGITGASGALYAKAILTALASANHEIHLAVTSYGKRLLHDELGMEGLDVHALCGLPDSADLRARNIFVHPSKDVGASIASGSFRHDGMIIVPCSSNTLGAVAGGMGDQLVYRAAAVALKERFPLILVHRESPLSLIDIENMRTLTLAGAIIAPANPGLYFLPTTIAEIVDFVAARTLDLLKVRHNLSRRWESNAYNAQSK